MGSQKITSAEYAQKMKDLINEVLELQNLEIVQRWFAGLGRNIAFGRDYSPSNMLMVYKQAPDAIWTEGPRSWNKIGCYWNAKTAIWIFSPFAFGVQCPKCAKRVLINKELVCSQCKTKLPDNQKPSPLGFKLIPVFDFSDVEVGPKGEKNPKVIQLRELQIKRLPTLDKFVTSDGAKFAKTAAALIRYIEEKGVVVKTKALNGSGGYCTPGLIVYDEALAMGENLGVLTHEWGHLCHHFGKDRHELSKQTRELEGEMFSALVLGGFGADIKPKAAYLLNWAGQSDKKTRETLFIKAFHRVYHEAVQTLKAVMQAVEPEINGLISQIQEASGPEPAEAKKKIVESTAQKSDEKIQIEIKRPGKLGSITADLESATKTLVADSGQFPGEAVKVQITLPKGGGVLCGAMLLDPVLLSGRYLQNGGAYAVPGATPLLLPYSKNYAEIKADQPQPKISIEEIDIQVNNFKRQVDSFAAANEILTALATKISRAIGPKAKCRAIFEDATLYECDIRLRKGLKGQIIQNHIKRKCSFLTGKKPEMVSDELYFKSLMNHCPEEVSVAEKILKHCNLRDTIEEPKKFIGAGLQMDLFGTLFGPNYQPPESDPDPDDDQTHLSECDYEAALQTGQSNPQPAIALPALFLGSIENQTFWSDTVEEASQLLGVPDEVVGDFFGDEVFATISIKEIYEKDGTPAELPF